VTAAALDNKGEIHLISSTSSSTKRALLDVTGSAGFGTAGVLSGNVELAGDSTIEFASGEITSLAASQPSRISTQLLLRGKDAFIEDSTALGSNSALSGLASIGYRANLDLQDKAAVSTTGALVNDGVIGLHDGTSLTLAGALTNSGELSIFNNALLDVTAGSAGFGTAGVLSGIVSLSGDSAIEFKSGQITSVAAYAHFFLGDGGDAFIEDSTALGSNSALSGLASIGSGATFDLRDGAAVSTTGALVNDGSFSAGSSLTVGGTLTNGGTLDIDQASASVTAKSFVNSGTVDLRDFATLNVSGATTNNRSISITEDTETLAGAVGGTGSFRLSRANLQFDSSVSAGQTINEVFADALILEQAQKFHATISGFGTGDTIDAANFLLSATTHHFVENSKGTGGTLTLHDQTDGLTANTHLTGHYTNSDFTLAPDSGTGTLVKFV
jgi:hypothetical protein